MTTYRVTTERVIQADSPEAAAEEAARTPPERFVVYANGYLEVTDVPNTFTLHDGDIVDAEILDVEDDDLGPDDPPSNLFTAAEVEEFDAERKATLLEIDPWVLVTVLFDEPPTGNVVLTRLSEVISDIGWEVADARYPEVSHLLHGIEYR